MPVTDEVVKAATNSSHKQLRTHTRMFWCGIGALTPIAINLLTVDVQTVFVAVSTAVLLGYAIRALSLFLIGAFVALWHPDEHRPKRLIEFGIAGPALLTSVMNGANSPMFHPTDEVAAVQVAEPAEWKPPVIQRVSLWQDTSVFSFRVQPAESVGSAFLRGLTGRASSGTWFVYLNQTFASSRDAHLRARDLRSKLSLEARVYEPGGPVPGYTVVLGDWLTEGEAHQMSARLKEMRLPIGVWAVK